MEMQSLHIQDSPRQAAAASQDARRHCFLWSATFAMAASTVVLTCLLLLQGRGCPPEKVSTFGPPIGSLTAAKAFARIVATDNGPDPAAANEELKIMATSSGLMPDSAAEQISAYQALRNTVSGKGVLYILDPKLLTLQFASTNTDPVKHNQQKYVAYRRVPDEPGGEPVRDAAGTLVMKTQAELMAVGYAGVEYMLHHKGHYSNVHLSVVADGQSVPVYLSYLWYDHNITEGQAQFKILLAKGVVSGGSSYVSLKNDGSAFTESDYEEVYHYSALASDRFQEISQEEFSDIVYSSGTIVSCGGVTFLTIHALSPVFHDSSGTRTDIQNPYGYAVLNAVKQGLAVYVGQSAGTVALSYAVGPLTEDTSFPDLTSAEDVNIDHGLGLEWLLPRIGEFLGIPYRLVFRPHLRFMVDSMKYSKNLNGADRVGMAIAGGVYHDVYCAILADYDFHEGRGDAIEISKGKVRYHVGFSDAEDILPETAQDLIRLFKPYWTYSGSTLRRQPLGNPEQGRSFEWTPASGDVFAAGPKSSMAFHMYSSTLGLFTDAPPLPETINAYAETGLRVV